MSSKVRSDDTGRIKDDVIRYYGLGDIAELSDKGNRGFNNVNTGRLLCPLKLIDEFDVNPME